MKLSEYGCRMCVHSWKKKLREKRQKRQRPLLPYRRRHQDRKTNPWLFSSVPLLLSSLFDFAFRRSWFSIGAFRLFCRLYCQFEPYSPKRQKAVSGLVLGFLAHGWTCQQGGKP